MTSFSTVLSSCQHASTQPVELPTELHSATLSMPPKVFRHLRSLATEQGIITANSRGKVDDSRSLKYYIFDRHVCRDAYAGLHMMGVNPRLVRLLQSVMNGNETAPTDTRFLKRKRALAPTPKVGEVYSYLSGLYNTVAEELREMDSAALQECGIDEAQGDSKSTASSSATVVSMVPAQSSQSLPCETVENEASEPTHASSCVPTASPTKSASSADRAHKNKRYLPPGSYFDQYQQFLATGQGSCSFKVFAQTWHQHFPNLAFRGKRQHATCAVCTRHKLLIASLGSEAAKNRQRLLYERHLESQFRDREQYWQVRAAAREPLSDTLCIIVDSIDQQKFCWPRARFLLSKQFDAFHRPRLHVTAALCHGRAAFLFQSHADVRQCGSTTVEIIAHVLTRLRDTGVDVAKKKLHIQLDNTSSTNKNSTVFAWAAVATQLGVVRECTVAFLRTGHTHEDSWPCSRYVLSRFLAWKANLNISFAKSFVSGLELALL